ncbi:phosphotransferase family protein [Actinoplanes sichuanensis]|uniref:Phosphotransferase family protein n=1 Tax=Actinoplanes sichuanensis TaxID=512349 RepID=A0ABW4AII6_9ACTN|nr:phosphotransferase family protein [Actinoplanes sichuanensis]
MTGPVRAEDAFDVDAVTAWLGLETTPEVRQFSGGASNLTYLLRTGERDLILRRPPTGRKAATAHDMSREYRIQSALAPVFPYVPRMVALCEDESVIGSPFYVMERVEGHIPRRELGVDLPPDRVRTLCTGVVDLLVDLHGIDPAAAGLDNLGKGTGYVARQVAGWSDRYRSARTRNVGSFAGVIRWLEANQPAEQRICLIHNDFRFDNVVFAPDDPTRPVALLDWEMATLGDPLMDLGSALAYWVQADDGWLFRMFRRQPTHTPGMLTRREVIEHYHARTGLRMTAFHEVFGLFRLAGIVQQIYYRYYHRQTRNPAFRNFWIASLMLERRCLRIIRAGKD